MPTAGRWCACAWPGRAPWNPSTAKSAAESLQLAGEPRKLGGIGWIGGVAALGQPGGKRVGVVAGAERAAETRVVGQHLGIVAEGAGVVRVSAESGAGLDRGAADVF